MNVAIRVDGGVKLGVGHILRCLTLANKLRDFGLNSTFFVRHLSKNLKQRISDEYELILLNDIDPAFNPKGEYSNWLGVNEKFDAYEFISKAEKLNSSLIIVDHYGIGEEWESIVNEKFSNLMVLDDLANRRHNTHLLVDQSIGCKKEAYSKLVSANCKILAGPKYALLREEFSLITNKIVKKYKILINFGGADKDNFTMHVLNILINSNLQNNLSIKVIIGKDYPYKSCLKKMVKHTKFHIVLLENPKNINLGIKLVACSSKSALQDAIDQFPGNRCLFSKKYSKCQVLLQANI